MELLSRAKNDRYTRPGHYQELEKRLRNNPATAQMPVLVCYAFDYRTRLGPFLFADTRLLTAGPRAIASALHSAGFSKTRIVLRQWNRNFRSSEARLDGEIPRMLFVSSMQIHSASAYEMIADAYKLGSERPLILAGGAKAIYEPWDFFGRGPNGFGDADVVGTGEEFVTLELLDRIMEFRGQDEHPRKVFHRLRRSGLLDDIPGLVFREGDEKDPAGRLINTGIQKLVQDLDELPHPIASLGLIEPPHQRRTLSSQPVPISKLHRYAGMISVVTTHGCKFHCPYCPIPAYNQFTFRWKSPVRLRQEFEDVGNATGINKYFGTEDTEFDVYKNKDLLPLCREGGLRAIWFGIEDMTAELVKKGQSPEKTKELFQIMNKLGIAPMAMMMHHDGQPLYSKGQLYGIVNQVNFL